MGRTGYVISALLALLGGGCVAPPPDITDWRPIQQRSFVGVSERTFEDAVQAVFAASRPGDYKLRIMPGEILAERAVNSYIVVATVQGKETWSLKYRGDGEALTASADATFNGSMITTVPMPWSERPNYPSQYSIFWERIDYVLGRRTTWPECATYPDASSTVEMVLGLCGMGWEDVRNPPKPVIAPPPSAKPSS